MWWGEFLIRAVPVSVGGWSLSLAPRVIRDLHDPCLHDCRFVPLEPCYDPIIWSCRWWWWWWWNRPLLFIHVPPAYDRVGVHRVAHVRVWHGVPFRSGDNPIHRIATRPDSHRVHGARLHARYTSPPTLCCPRVSYGFKLTPPTVRSTLNASCRFMAVIVSVFHCVCACPAAFDRVRLQSIQVLLSALLEA